MRGLPEDIAEAADEVRLGDVGDCRHRSDVEGLGVRAVHRVAGAKEASMQVLDITTHATTLRHRGRSGLGVRPGVVSTGG